MSTRSIFCHCGCGASEFAARIARQEQAGLLTCPVGHHSLLLDSRDYWADVLRDGKPRQSRCRCASVRFRVELVYDLRDDGDVRGVDVILHCASCGVTKTATTFEIDYSPTAELLAWPLDPIEQPWLKAKQCQITAYWQPADARRFASVLAGTAGVRMYEDMNGLRPRTLNEILFEPELKHDLYFTNTSDLVNLDVRDPQYRLPLLKLSRPYHILWPSGLTHLHYVSFADEVIAGAVLVKQPPGFVEFAQGVRDWLRTNYCTKRGKDSADNPHIYECIREHLKRSSP